MISVSDSLPVTWIEIIWGTQGTVSAPIYSIIYTSHHLSCSVICLGFLSAHPICLKTQITYNFLCLCPILFCFFFTEHQSNFVAQTSYYDRHISLSMSLNLVALPL